MEPPKKPAHSVIRFKDSQSAIDGTLEGWLPRLLESNDALEEALLLLRNLHLGRHTTDEAVVLKQVEDALEQSYKGEKRFLAGIGAEFVSRRDNDFASVSWPGAELKT
jgi:hypothetical protein